MKLRTSFLFLAALIGFASESQANLTCTFATSPTLPTNANSAPWLELGEATFAGNVSCTSSVPGATIEYLMNVFTQSPFTPTEEHRVYTNNISATPTQYPGSLQFYYIAVEKAPGCPNGTCSGSEGSVYAKLYGIVLDAPAAGVVGSEIIANTAFSWGDGDLSFHWTFSAKPAGSNAIISNADGSSALFVPDQPGTYVLRATAQDQGGHSFFKEKTITVTGAGNVNHAPAPTATAIRVAPGATGTTQIFPNDSDVGQLHAFEVEPAVVGASVDGNGRLTYNASQNFQGGLTIRVKVTDNGTPPLSGFIDVPVVLPNSGGNRAPIASLKLGNVVNILGRSIVWDASGSRDPDGDILSFSWRVVDKPADSVVDLRGSGGSKATFKADVEGKYTVEVTVSDGNLSNKDTKLVNIKSEANNSLVAHFSQGNNYWKNLPVGNASPDTIKDQMHQTGCTVTAWTDVLHGLGYSKFASGDKIDPGTVNARLAKQVGAWEGTARLKWDALPIFFDLMMQEFRDVCGSDTACKNTYNKALTWEKKGKDDVTRADIFDRIESGKMSLLQVPRLACTPTSGPEVCKKNEHHYVVPRGLAYRKEQPDNPEILIANPARQKWISLDYGDRTKKTGEYDVDKNPHAGRIDGMINFEVITGNNPYRTMAMGLGRLVLSLNGPGDIFLISPSGRREGVDPSTGESFREVEGAFFYGDGGTSLGIEELNISQNLAVQGAPEQGAYAAKISGFVGCRTLALSSRSSGGKEGLYTNREICLSQGDVASVEVSYDSGKEFTNSSLSDLAAFGTIDGLRVEGQFGSSGVDPTAQEVTVMLNGISQNLTIPSGFFQSSGGVYSYASNVAEGIEAFTIWPDGRFTISLGAAALRGDVEQAYHPIRIIVGSRAFSGLVQPSEDTSNSFSGVHFDKSAYAPGDSIFISINQLYQPNHGNEVVYRATFGGSVFEPLRKSDRLLIGRKVAGPAGRYLLVVQAYERSKKRALAIERELAELEKQIKRLENRISDAPAKDLPLLYQNLAELITRRDAASDTLQSLETRVGKEIRAFALVQ